MQIQTDILVLPASSPLILTVTELVLSLVIALLQN